MKIAVIGVRGIPAKQGQIERYCQELYPKIAQKEHQVDLFVQPQYHDQPWFSTYYYKNVKIITLLSLPGKKLDLFVNSALNTIWATFGNYDVIHIHGLIAAWFSWFPHLFSRSKIIVTCQKLDYQKTQWRKTLHWFLPWIERIAVSNADELIVVSRGLKAYFSKKYNITACYIPNAPKTYVSSQPEFEYSQLLELQSKQYILYLGRLVPENKPDLLIKAFQKLQPTGWKLVLAGGVDNSANYTVELLKMVRRENNIIFTNEIRGCFLTEIVQGAGLLIAPGDSSDLGLSSSILEAMREGIPILASNTPAHKELIATNRGLLFESDNLNSLITQLKYALSEPDLLQTMAKQAQMYIAINHNWDRVIYGHLSLYLKTATKSETQDLLHKSPKSWLSKVKTQQPKAMQRDLGRGLQARGAFKDSNAIRVTAPSECDSGVSGLGFHASSYNGGNLRNGLAPHERLH
jgi:glycosyltransferase involved in cell wall biosynthesis